MPEEAFQNLAGFFRQLCFIERRHHQFEPTVARTFVHRELPVPHPQTGMSALFDIAHGSAEAAYQKVAQTFFRPGHVGGGVHRS